MADTSNLYTTVKNPLGSTHVYGYLGVHGKTLAGGASFTQIGDLLDVVQMRGQATSKRKTDAIERDLLNSRLEIIQTPSVVLKDDTTGEIKVLDLDGGTLGVVDPSWGAYTDA